MAKQNWIYCTNCNKDIQRVDNKCPECGKDEWEDD